MLKKFKTSIPTGSTSTASAGTGRPTRPIPTTRRKNRRVEVKVFTAEKPRERSSRECSQLVAMHLSPSADCSLSRALRPRPLRLDAKPRTDSPAGSTRLDHRFATRGAAVARRCCWAASCVVAVPRRVVVRDPRRARRADRPPLERCPARRKPSRASTSLWFDRELTAPTCWSRCGASRSGFCWPRWSACRWASLAGCFPRFNAFPAR